MTRAYTVRLFSTAPPRLIQDLAWDAGYFRAVSVSADRLAVVVETGAIRYGSRDMRALQQRLQRLGYRAWIHADV